MKRLGFGLCLTVVGLGFMVLTGPMRAWSFEADAEWSHWQRLFFERQSEEKPDSNPGAASKDVRIRQQEVTAVLPGTQRRVADMTGYDRELCVSCHIGISPVNEAHPATFGCIVCHGGDGSTLNREQAHADLIHDPDAGTGKRNPSSLSVVHLSCGRAGCHGGHSDAEKNHVERVRNSIMGTVSGMIAGLRFQWGAQETSEARYGFKPVEQAPEAVIRPGAVRGLKTLPHFTQGEVGNGQETESATAFSHHPADGMLRGTCRQCHLDSPPAPDDYRSQGCAACHVPYGRDGLYKGKDPTVNRKTPGHPDYHRMAAVPPPEVCTTCHKTFSGMMQTDNPDSKENLLPEAGRPVVDVHFKAGMECVDCHTQSDIMGDGQIYSRQYQAVEVRCTTCHGDARRFPSVLNIEQPEDPAVRLSRLYPNLENQPGDWMAVTSHFHKMSNVKATKEGIITFGKRTGKSYSTPLVKDHPAHTVPGHEDKLSCTACHSAWVPQCTGCHLTFNAGRDREDEKPWNPFRFELEFKKPALMVGPDGKARPMLAQPERRLTAFDDKGHPYPVLNRDGDATGEYRDFGFVNPLGYSGANLAYATHPHSVTRKGRSCASCHVEPASSGLGEGLVEWGRRPSGKQDRFQPVERNVGPGKEKEIASSTKLTPLGQPVAGVHQPEARLFNQEELNRIYRVGNCLPCHSEADDPIYQDMASSYRVSATARHKALARQGER